MEDDHRRDGDKAQDADLVADVGVHALPSLGLVRIRSCQGLHHHRLAAALAQWSAARSKASIRGLRDAADADEAHQPAATAHPIEALASCRGAGKSPVMHHRDCRRGPHLRRS